MTRLAIAAVAVSFAACTLTADQSQESLPGASNYTRVDTTVACGGATSPEALAELKQRGFAAVINLRQASEQGADIPAAKAAAESAGLAYIHIPFNGGDPQPAIADEFLKQVTDPAHSPVYIHCASANRVGALWLIKRVAVDGWTVEKATEEAERIGLRSARLKEFALEYLKAKGKA